MALCIKIRWIAFEKELKYLYFLKKKSLLAIIVQQKQKRVFFKACKVMDEICHHKTYEITIRLF